MAMERYSFYVIDNLQHAEAGRPFVATSGLTLEEAIKYYSELPDTQEKALGITADNGRSVDLVVCRPLSNGHAGGQNLLLNTYRRHIGLWFNATVAEAVSILRRTLSIKLTLKNGRASLYCPFQYRAEEGPESSGDER